MLRRMTKKHSFIDYVKQVAKEEEKKNLKPPNHNIYKLLKYQKRNNK